MPGSSDISTTSRSLRAGNTDYLDFDAVGRHERVGHVHKCNLGEREKSAWGEGLAILQQDPRITFFGRAVNGMLRALPLTCWASSANRRQAPGCRMRVSTDTSA